MGTDVPFRTLQFGTAWQVASRLATSTLDTAGRSTMPKVLVLFYSRTGNTAALADAIAEGAATVKFTEVEIRRVPELPFEATTRDGDRTGAAGEALSRKYRALESVDELAEYDALVLGSPTRYGVMSAELKHVLDRTGHLWKRGAFVDKVGSAFSTVSTPHGGHELTIQSILVPMMQLGMIVVTPGYTDPVLFTAGSPYGATATTARSGPTDADLAVARHQGRRVATVTEWIRHAKSHGHKH